jgi:hypothetical protein
MGYERAWQAYLEAMNRHNAVHERLAARTLLHVGWPPMRPQALLSENELRQWLELTREVEEAARRRRETLDAYIAVARSATALD